MPDREPSGNSRVCPSCGRRVPRSVAVCRCGVEMPLDFRPADPIEVDEPERRFSPAFVVILIVLAGAGYWMITRPGETGAVITPGSSAPPTMLPDKSTPQPNPAMAASEAAAATSASAAARAWDLQASTQPASPDAVPVLGKVATAPVASNAAPGSIEEMVDRVMPAVVLIETSSGRGSGFYVNTDTLITNVHVVQNDSYVTLRRMDGSTVSARVDKKAPAFDIAVLKVTGASPSQAVIPMGHAQSLKAGQEIIVIGTALGTLQNTVSRGIVSGLRTSGGATLVQTDAAVNPGNSGGPMLDRSGSVIGVTTMGYKGAEGLNFGVAIDHVRDLLEGRQTNVGSTGGLTTIQSQARGSESERQQQQGDQQFRAGLAQMAQNANDVDAEWKRFRDQCYKSPIAGSYQREWFAVLVPQGIPGNAAAGCTSYYASMQGDIKQFHDLMQRLVSEARRANILPGTVRDQLRLNRLDFDWDR